MKRLLITQLEKEDIKERIELLYDYHVQKNLNHSGPKFTKQELYDQHLKNITHEYYKKRYYVVRTHAHKTLGYCWITDIDWVNRTCELSIALFPAYRIGYGQLALLQMYDYLYKQLNMKTIVNQVLEGNELLRSKHSVLSFKQVECRFDSFTQGRYRTSYYWTQTLTEHKALAEKTFQRNAAIKDKVRQLQARAPS